jgi:hypothetical protein
MSFLSKIDGKVTTLYFTNGHDITAKNEVLIVLSNQTERFNNEFL